MRAAQSTLAHLRSVTLPLRVRAPPTGCGQEGERAESERARQVAEEAR